MGFLRFRRTWVERAFWKSEREAQLARFETLCSKLAELCAVNGEICEAAAFAERAHRAAALQTAGWSQSDLNELGGQFPDGGVGGSTRRPSTTGRLGSVARRGGTPPPACEGDR